MDTTTETILNALREVMPESLWLNLCAKMKIAIDATLKQQPRHEGAEDARDAAYPLDFADAWNVANHRKANSNLARCYIALANRPQADGLDLSALVTDEAVSEFDRVFTEEWDRLSDEEATRKAIGAALPLLLAAVRKNL